MNIKLEIALKQEYPALYITGHLNDRFCTMTYVCEFQPYDKLRRDNNFLACAKLLVDAISEMISTYASLNRLSVHVDHLCEQY